LALHIFFTSDLIVGFPNEVVVRTYMNPEVDDSQEKFSWGQPELDLIIFISEMLMLSNLGSL
jgi:hypothetical protein